MKKQMIRYADKLAEINSGQLRGFFVGWRVPHSPDSHYEILKKSSHFVCAMEEENGRVVGFVNCLTDGIQSAYIPLLEVLPGYQGQGIGGELMRRILERVKEVKAIDLTCDEELQTYYQKFGMIPSVGMMLRNT